MELLGLVAGLKYSASGRGRKSSKAEPAHIIISSNSLSWFVVLYVVEVEVTTKANTICLASLHLELNFGRSQRTPLCAGASNTTTITQNVRINVQSQSRYINHCHGFSSSENRPPDHNTVPLEALLQKWFLQQVSSASSSNFYLANIWLSDSMNSL